MSLPVRSKASRMLTAFLALFLENCRLERDLHREIDENVDLRRLNEAMALRNIELEGDVRRLSSKLDLYALAKNSHN